MNRLWSSLRKTRVVVVRRYLSAGVNSGSELPWSVVKPFGSIRVDLTKAYSKGWTLQGSFPAMLQRYEQEWKSRDHRAVWLHIPIPLSGLISVASDEGYMVHHGNREEVVMNKWLCEKRVNRLPHYASHQVGVCGVVMREDSCEILVTQDKYRPPLWKFPGGLAEVAEDISCAAIREVKEETGITSEFKSILAFREQHNLLQYFGVSDLYFMCRMQPLTFDIDHCTHEVLKCAWKPVEEMACSKDSTPLTQLVCKFLLKGHREGFENIDISEHAVESHLPFHSKTTSYNLFMRTSPGENIL